MLPAPIRSRALIACALLLSIGIPGTALAQGPAGPAPAKQKRPDEETSSDALFNPRLEEDGSPVLSYPARTPEEPKAPESWSKDHGFVVPATAVSALTLAVLGLPLGGLLLCDDLGEWGREVFRRSSCGVGPIFVSGLFMWAGAVIGVTYFHGDGYEGPSLETIGLVGLGIVLGGAVSSAVWLATENRAVVGTTTAVLMTIGAVAFAEMAVHGDPKPDRKESTGATIGIAAAPVEAGGQAVVYGRF
ncbi:MAG: hypothetical protein KC416_04745 [Myxococcales bacterium]|nr:hypothetical protein [Myxococcales bacterium]